jgi:hypothetical protein
MVLPKLLHEWYQSFVVCKLGPCLLGERAHLAHKNGKIFSTAYKVQRPVRSGRIEALTKKVS